MHPGAAQGHGQPRPAAPPSPASPPWRRAGCARTFISAVERATQRSAKLGRARLIRQQPDGWHDRHRLHRPGSCDVYFWVIIAAALISWVNPDPVQPDRALPLRVTEPVLGPSGTGSHAGGRGWTCRPMIVLIAIYLLESFLVGSLRDLAVSLRVAAEGPDAVDTPRYSPAAVHGADVPRASTPRRWTPSSRTWPRTTSPCSRRTRLLKEQLEALEERSRGIEDREKALQETAGHHPAAGRGDEGERPARGPAIIVREAELRGEQVRGDVAHRGGRASAPRFYALKRARRRLAEDLPGHAGALPAPPRAGPGATARRVRSTPARVSARVRPRAAARRSRVQPRASRDEIVGWRARCWACA